MFFMLEFIGIIAFDFDGSLDIDDSIICMLTKGVKLG